MLKGLETFSRLLDATNLDNICLDNTGLLCLVFRLFHTQSSFEPFFEVLVNTIHAACNLNFVVPAYLRGGSTLPQALWHIHVLVLMFFQGNHILGQCSFSSSPH